MAGHRLILAGHKFQKTLLSLSEPCELTSVQTNLQFSHAFARYSPNDYASSPFQDCATMHLSVVVASYRTDCL